MFKVGDRVRNPRVPEAGVGVVECVKPDGGYLVNYKDTWYGRCHDDDNTLVHACTVRTETVTKRRIVPGVYGRIRIWADSPSGMVRWSITGQSGVNCHDMTATELDDLAMVASQLAEALRDDLD